MKPELKRVRDQVIVITGASSGIGLVTARLAAKRGAKVVLTSRSRTDLRRAVQSIEDKGGEATYVVADVTDEGDVRGVVRAAIKRFGRIDTWVNNAGVSIYGRIEEVSLRDARRLFETNYWGVVNGSLAAIPHLREHGGALINLGSIVSERAVPLQGHYSASKHAIKGFTDALRMELEEEGAPISVTLIKPAAIDTPYPEHAKNYLDVEPRTPPPVYHPRTVARAILRAAERPTRELTVGGGGRMITAMGNLLPRLTDRVMEASMFEQQKTDTPSPWLRKDSLHRPKKGSGRERGGRTAYALRTSAYTEASMRPLATAVTLAAVGAGLYLALRDDDAPPPSQEFPGGFR